VKKSIAPKVTFLKMTTSHPTAYRSFGEQTTEYTNRSNDTVSKQSVNSPVAWYETDLAAKTNTWRYALSAEEVEEIRRAVSSITTSGIALTDVSRDNFVLPALSNKVQSWRDELMSGIGVKYVTGLTVDSFTRTETEIAFWGIGHHMGIPGAENPDRELLGHGKGYG
ncbi:uncharacterized protein METZ01_LOCUS387336, partial [marine metagenome]